MIGIRAVASGTLAVVVAAAAAGQGGDVGPGGRLGADRLVWMRAERADRILAELEERLGSALDDARRGAARMVAGDASPGMALERAAATTREAEPAAVEAIRAIDALDAARRAREPGTGSIQPPPGPGDLASIAGQLDATAEAGDEFAAMRHRADDVTRSLERALVALEAGDLDAAEEAVESARADHTAVADWDLVLATLPVWIETTDAMIGAMETIIAATRAGDSDAARQAADAFAGLDAEGEVADRALRIAISEGGASVAATALGRLSGARASVAATREEVAVILQAERR